MKDDKTKTTGRRIRFFRERAGMSQMDLEMAIGASAGAISRIENGTTNPTKETINKVANVLHLTFKERGYLMGLEDKPVQESEKDYVRKEVEKVFKNPLNFSYVLDFQDEMICISSGFKLLFKLGGLDANQLIGHSIFEIVFNPELKIRDMIAQDKFEKIANNMFTFWLKDRGYALNEQWAKNLLKKCSRYPDFDQLLNKAQKEEVDYYTDEARYIDFEIAGKHLQFSYEFIPLLGDTRFHIIKYKLHTKDNLKKFLKL